MSALSDKRIYAAFGAGSLTGLPQLCLDLYAEQKEAWLELRDGCEALQAARTRDLSGGFLIRLQHNPARIKSSMAGTGQDEAGKRRCFLCLDHLPEAQRGVLYRKEYLILCNPRPVFAPHFTIIHLNHCPQAIAPHMDAFLQLMADAGSSWVVLYNGPKCGASAPDHLHFQAAPYGKMPIEKEIREAKGLIPGRPLDGALLYWFRDLGREVLLLTGGDPTALGGALKSFLQALQKVLATGEEPMINIAGFRKAEKWSLLVFPRRKHRPDAFFREGDSRVVVSPGIVEMGGILVTPLERDFEKLDRAAVEGIYREVSLEAEAVERAVEAMR